MTESSIASGSVFYRLVLANLLSAISYEMKYYGVQNVLDGVKISINTFNGYKIQKTSHDWSNSQGFIIPNEQYFVQETDIDKIIQKEINAQGEVASDYSLEISKGNHEKTTMIPWKKLQILPDVVCVNYPTKYVHYTRKPYITVTDNVEKRNTDYYLK